MERKSTPYHFGTGQVEQNTTLVVSFILDKLILVPYNLYIKQLDHLINMNESQKIMEALFKITRLLRNRLPCEIKPAKISILQLHALIFIKKQQPISMHEIADMFQITKPTATSLLSKLIKLELVKREYDKEDRRVIRISLSEKGQKMFSKIMSKTLEKLQKVLKEISKEDKGNLVRIINDISKKMEENYEKNI
jgi:MarR family transcriptional regulator, organic hydroperoxide resistance regulator